MTDILVKDCKPGDLMHPTYIDEPVSRIIGCGDVHGDPDVVIGFLTVSNCIQTTTNTKNVIEFYGSVFEWIGSDTVVVQVGDQIDSCRPTDDARCDEEGTTLHDVAMDIEILRFFTDLDKLAKRHGGRVICLLGNHELMNVMGNMKYVSYNNIKQFADKNDTIADALIKRKQYFAGKARKYLACTRLSCVVVRGIYFIHGGFIADMKKKRYSPKKINLLVQKWLLESIKSKDKAREVQDNIINNKNGIFWNRQQGLLPSDNEHSEQSQENHQDDLIKQCLKYDMDSMKGIVIGHTTQTKHNGINSTCNGKIWRIDGGPSHAFDKFRTTKRVDIEVIEIKFDYEGNPLFQILKTTK